VPLAAIANGLTGVIEMGVVQPVERQPTSPIVVAQYAPCVPAASVAPAMPRLWTGLGWQFVGSLQYRTD
jgi:hypothetical protein